jgi:hypothetical protein
MNDLEPTINYYESITPVVNELILSINDLIGECQLLLEMARNSKDEGVRLPLKKSSIVLLIAYWERYVEDLIISGSKFISDSLRNSMDLPIEVKQCVANRSIPIKRDHNMEEFSSSVWRFSGSGWRIEYESFAKELAESINTASLKNVRNAYKNVFGIRDVFESDSNIEVGYDVYDDFNKLLLIRHKIAHGDKEALVGVEEKDIDRWIETVLYLIVDITGVTMNKLISITGKSAKVYSLRRNYIIETLQFFEKNGTITVTNDLFKQMGSTANSNYNKMGYEPWKLLSVKSPKEITPTQRMFDFIEGKIELPIQIVVLKDFKSIPKNDTKLISYKQLLKQYEKQIKRSS